MTYDYESESAKKLALNKLNGGEQRIKKINEYLKAIQKELKYARLDFVYCRTVVFGRGKGSTGKQKNLYKRKK